MAGRIVRSLNADHDLAELFDYIAMDSGVDRAEAVLRRIEQTLESLAAFPRIGRIRHELEGTPRSFAIWPWTVIYEPLDKGEGILVWRVIDGRRDQARLDLSPPKR